MPVTFRPTSAHLDQMRCDYLVLNEYHLCIGCYVEQKCVILFYLSQWTKISYCELLIIHIVKEDNMSVY